MSHQQKWNEKLSSLRADLIACLNGLPETAWQTPVFGEGEGWSVANLVGHLIDSERGMSIHVHKIRKGEETLPPDFDLNRWNSGVQARIGDRTPAELLTALAATRAKTLEVMNSLQAAEWALRGRHPSRGEISVEEYYETIYLHEQMHLRDIQKATQNADKVPGTSS